MCQKMYLQLSKFEEEPVYMSGVVCACSKVMVEYNVREVEKKNKDTNLQSGALGDLWQRIFSYVDCPEIAGTSRFFREQYVKRVRLILQAFFSKEKIVSLLPLFTSYPISPHFSDHEALCMYYQIRVVHNLLGNKQKNTPKRFLDLIQNASWRSLGILSQDDVESKNPKERGALLESMIAAGISVASREVVQLKRGEQILCLPKEISALSLKVLDVRSQGLQQLEKI